MAMTANEFWKRTGVTEGYAAEILKDAEHAAWHMPQGAAFVTETPVDPEDVTVDEDIDDPTVPTDTTVEAGGDLIVDEDDESEPNGGSVEGETEE